MYDASISSTVASVRQVDGLGDRAGEERLHRRHHPDVAHVVDRAGAVQRAERAVEDGQVLGLEVRRALDRVLLVDVRDDLVDLGLGVAEALERQRGRCG